jgi:nucleoside-diphosphate-sugar epimerase
LYIDDLVSLVNKSLTVQKENFLLINAGSDQGISVLNLVKLVAKIAGKSLNIEFDSSKPTLKFSFICDSSKASELLGWKSTTSLEEGISKSINWYKENSTESVVT